MDTLAYALGEQGRYAEAEKLYRQTLEIGTRILGLEHQRTLNGIGNVAWEVEQEGPVCRSRETEPAGLGDRAKIARGATGVGTEPGVAEEARSRGGVSKLSGGAAQR